MRKSLLVILAILATLVFSSAVFAAGPFKAVYWDENIQVNWADQHERVRDYFDENSYTILDAAALEKFMNDRIADKAPSVIVFAQDRAPSNVVPEASADVLLIKYLKAGGKIVWIADIPFWTGQDIDTGDGIPMEYSGAAEILGVTHEGATWDTNSDVIITEAGKKWGLTENEIWPSVRAVDKSLVDIVLAEDSEGQAACWVKTFGGPEGTGFVRVWDRGGAPEDLSWVKAVAEYGFAK